MRNLKKLASIVLAAVMTLALAVPAFATEGDPAPEYKITVTNPQPGSTYNFYKIFDMTSTGTNFSYTATSKWADFFAENAPGADYLTTEANDHPVVINGVNKFLNLTETNIADFANAARDYALTTPVKEDDSGELTGEEKTIEKTFTDGGYYMVFATNATQATSNSSMCILTNTAPDQTVTIKSTKPSIDKTIDEAKWDGESAQVGDVVPFKITGVVPDTTGFSAYTYRITDTMSAGLTYAGNDSVTVKVDGVTLNEHYSFEADPGTATFVLNIDVMALQDKVGKTIEITYSATVNANATTSYDPETNTVSLTYGDPNSGTEEETTPVVVNVYTSKIVIDKFEGEPNSDEKPTDAKQLAGAKFNLYQMNGDAKLYYVYAEGGEKVQWIAKEGEDDSAVWYEYTYDVETATWTKSSEATTLTPTEVTTNPDGAAEFGGLRNGTYYLKETEAPEGYNKLTEAKMVTVAVVGVAYDSATDQKLTTKDEVDAAREAGTLEYRYDTTVTAPVANLSGTALPETGGMGTTLFYALGGLLVVGAGILLITKKRMGAE